MQTCSSSRRSLRAPGPPNINGGNVDTKHITVGSTVYLPVHVEGGYLSVGDGHAAQGDGEVCGSAIETVPSTSCIHLALSLMGHVQSFFVICH